MAEGLVEPAGPGGGEGQGGRTARGWPGVMPTFWPSGSGIDSAVRRASAGRPALSSARATSRSNGSLNGSPTRDRRLRPGDVARLDLDLGDLGERRGAAGDGRGGGQGGGDVAPAGLRLRRLPVDRLPAEVRGGASAVLRAAAYRPTST